MATTVKAQKMAETDVDQSMHALPRWFAFFQKTFGLSFLVGCSAYLIGKLATLGWVRDLYNPLGWGWFNAVGVVLFFLGGVTLSGIALTCSLTFARVIQKRPYWFSDLFTTVFMLLGMLLFFAIEVWASLAERSTYLIATPIDKAVLSALGFHGTPPISPTVLIISVMFPLGSIYYGFVQQGRQRTTVQDITDEDTEMERKIHRAKKAAELRQVQAQGLVGVGKAVGQAVRRTDDTPASASADTDAPTATDTTSFQ